MASCWQSQASLPGSNWFPQGSQPCLNSTFRDLVHAFPRPRNTSRVMKPRSAGNSPSSANKRRTTMPHASAMCRPTVPNQPYQAPYDATLLASAMRGRRSRPISWHPASARTLGYSNAQYYPASTTSDNLPAMAMPAQSMHGLPTYANDNMMYPTSDLPVSNEPFPAFSAFQDPDPMQQASFLQMNSSPVDPAVWDANTSNYPTFSQPMSDGWTFDMMAMNNNMPSIDVAGSSYESVPSSGVLTGPSTPDFLPIQQPDDADSLSELASTKPKAEEELVGMGLYNQPDCFLDSYQGLAGKGLKLEETFTPDDENKDADEDEDEEDEPEEVPEPKSNTESFKQQSKPSMLNQSFFFEDDDFEPKAVSGTQPMINMASQPCIDYGYGWI